MTNQEIADKVNKHFGFDEDISGQVLAEDVEAYLEDGYDNYLTREEVKYIDWLTDDCS